jgi:hypothetical protein
VAEDGGVEMGGEVEVVRDAGVVRPLSDADMEAADVEFEGIELKAPA